MNPAMPMLNRPVYPQWRFSASTSIAYTAERKVIRWSVLTRPLKSLPWPVEMSANRT
jgi:hypothetical protein